MVKELLALVNAGTICVIDILILTKDDDGAAEATELSHAGEPGELQALEAQLAELLAEEDVEHLAAAMEPGSTAGVAPTLRAPVAKTAVVAKAVTPGPAPIAKTAVVAAAVTPGRRRRIWCVAPADDWRPGLRYRRERV